MECGSVATSIGNRCPSVGNSSGPAAVSEPLWGKTAASQSGCYLQRSRGIRWFSVDAKCGDHLLEADMDFPLPIALSREALI